MECILTLESDEDNFFGYFSSNEENQKIINVAEKFLSLIKKQEISLSNDTFDEELIQGNHIADQLLLIDDYQRIIL